MKLVLICVIVLIINGCVGYPDTNKPNQNSSLRRCFRGQEANIIELSEGSPVLAYDSRLASGCK